MMKRLLLILVVAPILAQTGVIRVQRRATTSSDLAAITSITLGTDYNGSTDCRGMAFRLTSQPITITSLGRWVYAGNSGTHSLLLTDSSASTLASCSLNTSGLSVGWHYCSITPYVISSTDAFFSVYSQELNGGDHWSYANTGVSSTILTAVQDDDGGISTSKQ